MSMLENVHRFERLLTPSGDRVPIDAEMVRLIRALWALELETAGSCQNLGESISPGVSRVNHGGRRRHAHFYTGQAWLKMPVGDACTFLSLLGKTTVFRQRINRWTMPEAWEAFVYITMDDHGASPSTWAQVHFPRTQINEVTERLIDEQANRDR